MNNKAIYFPGLNGLRAIAAISVVISHTTLALKDFNLDPGIFGIGKDGKPLGVQLGGYGVSIFFALSGFLITYLLQEEKQSAGIDIKKFYIRRILRIWPLYYLYLSLAVVTIFAFSLQFDLPSFLYYFFYAANIPSILRATLPFLHHYWSLGVEEQFYLFWPWVIKKINKRLVIILIVTIIFLIALKLIIHVLYLNSIADSVFAIARFHCMMIGGLGAVLYRKQNKLFLKISDNKLVQFACWLVIILSACNHFSIASVIDNEIMSVIAVFLIIGQVNVKHRIVNLENKTCDFLGKISYGIYVIHPLMIFYCSKFLHTISLKDSYKYILVYFTVTGGTVLFAYLSYHYFEKYFLKLKGKFTVIKSISTSSSE